ncbi:hypothetical protein H0H93_012555, partial [Arthromyces matolae]
MVSLKLDFASIFPQATRRNLFSSSSIVNFFIGLVNRLLENDNLDDITPAPIYHATPTIKPPPTSTRSIEESPLPTPPLWFCLLVVFIFMTLPFIRFFTRRPKPSPRLRSIPRPSPVPSRPSRLWRVLSSISKGKVIRTFLYAIILSQCAPTMVDALIDAVTIKFPPYLALQPPSVGTIYRIHISIASGVFTVLIILVPHFIRAWKRDKLREGALVTETRRPSPSDVLETEDRDTSEDISSLRPHKDDSHVEHPDSNAVEPSPSTSDTLPIPTLASLSVFPSIPSHQTLSTCNSHTSFSILGSSTVDSETPCQRTSSIPPHPFPSPTSTLPLRITYPLSSSPSLPSLRTVTASNSNESLHLGDHEVEDARANDLLVDEYLDSFNASANRTLEWIEDQQSFFHAAADEDGFEVNENDNDDSPGSEACDEDDSSSSLDSLDRFRHEMFGEANDSDLEAGDDNGNGNDSSSSICSLDVFRVHVPPEEEEEEDPEIDGDREEKEDWSETEIDAFEALIAAVHVVSGEDLEEEEEESGTPPFEAEGDHVPSADSDDLGDILIREDPTGHVEDDESGEDTDAYTSEEEEDSEDTLDSSTDSEENDSEIDGDRAEEEDEEEEEDWSETEVNAFEGLLGDVHVVEDGESGEDLDEAVEEEASDSSIDSSEENDAEIDGEEEEEEWSEIEINALEGLIADVHVSEDGGSGGDLHGQEEEEEEALGSSPDSEDLLAAEADESIEGPIPDVLKLEKDLTVDELEHEHGIVDALPDDIPIPARFDSGLSTDCDWSLVFEGVSFVEIEDGKTGKNDLIMPPTVNDETSGSEEDMVMMIQGGTTTTTPSIAAQSESTNDAGETITNFVDDDNQIGDSEIMMHQEFPGDAVAVGDGDGDDGVSGEIYDVQAEVEDPFHYGGAGVAEVSQSLRHIEDQDINFVQASTSDFGIQGEPPCCDTGHHSETFIDADEEVHDLDVTTSISESRDLASILSSSSVDIPIPSWETLEDERERMLLQQDPGYSGIGMSSISNTCQNLSNELQLQGEPLLGFDSSPSPIHTSPSLAAVYDSQSLILEGTDDTTGSPSKSSAPSASSDLPLTMTT